MPDAGVLMSIALSVGLVLAFTLGVTALYAKLYVKVSQGQAVVINKMAEVHVYFTGGLVLPFVHKAEFVDVSTHKLTIDRRGEDGVLLEDQSRADVVADVYVRVAKTPEDVLRAAAAVGAARTGDVAALESIFLPKFESALEMVCARAGFETLHRDREALTKQMLETIGEDLSGFVVDDIILRVLARSATETAA